jgi:hypothetical protein
MQVAVRKNIEQRIVNVRAKIVSTQNQLPLRSHPDLNSQSRASTGKEILNWYDWIDWVDWVDWIDWIDL